MPPFYAHSVEDAPPEHWEPLPAHLEQVAALATQFGRKFNAAPWANSLGKWHDLGKYSDEFQAYLKHENGLEAHLEQYVGKVDHSTAGAQLADRLFDNHPYGRILAYCIAGHHAGLADAVATSGSSGLNQRLTKSIPSTSGAPDDLLRKPDLPKTPPIQLSGDESHIAFQLAFFTRMLFSCLVDADYLATEQFMSPEKSKERSFDIPSFAELEVQLDNHLSQLASGQSGPVASSRTEVLDACRNAAEASPGLFSLTVPTGGGKTLSSLAFGLKHAQQHHLDRIIYAIPFTSIIEQTANVFRNVFWDAPEETILEHHSNTDPDKETICTRLVTQNWDAPLVVTTNVQLFESVFAAQTSRCRKLHNICNSVIILDEVQSLPVDLLKPTLAAIHELVTNYGCTIVLCTATQPAFQKSRDFEIGLANVTEIVPDPISLFASLNRVRISHLGQQSDDEIVQQFSQHEQFLCIVNTRAHAANLFEQLRTQSLTRPNSEHPLPTSAAHDADKDDGIPTNQIFHLSTYMCGQHRKATLDKIRQRLKDKLPCQVISTQLIEAGVDVDFPVVYRSQTGIDSIAQAAGRCNREGKLPTGQVFVFEPTDVALRGYLKATADSASELMADLNLNNMDLLNQDIVRRYFGLHFWRHKKQWDAKQVMNCFPAPYQKTCFDFRTAAERFRWIDDTSETVFVPYDDTGRTLINKLRWLESKPQEISKLRKVLRQLQRYSVSLFPNIYRAMLATDIELLDSGHAILVNETCYDKELGFRPDQQGYHEPSSLIC